MSRALIVCLLATLSAAPALAQQAPATPPAAPDPLLGGPVIPGVCMVSQQAVVAASKMGQAATARLQELSQQTQAELSAQSQPLQTEEKALAAKRSTLTEAAFEKQAQALTEREQPIRQLANQRQRELEATRTKAFKTIWVAAIPMLQDQYRAHGCGLLLDRNSVWSGNMANDLTPGVVQALDAKITTITFDRESLPANAAAPQ